MSAVFAARRKRSRADFATTMAQGVQPLVRNAVTQNSPDIRVSGLFASHAEPQRGVSEANRRIAAALRLEMDAHTGLAPV